MNHDDNDSRGRRWTDPSILARIAAMEERLDRGDSRMGAIEDDLSQNTSATKEILEIVTMGKGFFRVLGAIGTFLKYTFAIVASVVALVAAWNSRTHS